MTENQDLFLSVSDMEKLHLFEQVRQLKMSEASYRDDLEAHRSLDMKIGDINFRQTAVQMKKSYGSIYNTYDGIVQDIKKLLKKDDPTTEEIFSIDNDAYHFFLVSQSDAYNFLLAIIEDTCDSFERFYKERGNSKATALRHLRPMRMFLKKFNVRITYERMRFVGKETDVRLALSTMCWEATRGYVWPFESIDEVGTNLLVHKFLQTFQTDVSTSMTIKFYNIYTAINCLRLYRDHPIQEDTKLSCLQYPNLNIYDNFVNYDEMNEFSNTKLAHIFSYFKTLSPEILMNESCNTYNLINCALSVVPEPIKQADQRYQYLRDYNTVLYDFVNEFFQAMPYNIQQRFDVNYDTMKLYKISLANVMVGGLAYGESYYQMLAIATGENIGLSSIDLPELKKQIRNVLQHLFEKDEFTDFQGQEILLTDIIYKVVLRLVVIFSKHFAVKIYPSIETNQLYYLDLIYTLSSLPYVELVEKPQDADLIVTSSSKAGEKPVHFDAYIFKWEYDKSNAQYGSLLTLIRDIWTHKKISE
ncbi:helix-turn-helix domain-containing protein [Bombilactobacillus folatiphilus]|uniref:Helix-turn-helix domain-containing protein n=1 Tax=Bombilactobacillus folatiphilus TaxID=2923362 RepID=A0ABY4P809_9LACO|nr:helix-turn-helix domain-containing protein [Bombilactobacillus folatiphilus]UQS81845.1 helix-turn-helix domain-containing protein [Bombilactobacillus folatiphilus]